MTAVREHFVPVFLEAGDNAEFVERFGIVYFPAFVWTDAKGEVIDRTVQPTEPQELLDDLWMAVEDLAEKAPAEDG